MIVCFACDNNAREGFIRILCAFDDVKPSFRGHPIQYCNKKENLCRYDYVDCCL